MDYQQVLANHGYTKLQHGYIKGTETDVTHYVTLFDKGKVQVWATSDYGHEDAKYYDTNIIPATPEELDTLIRLIAID